MGFDLIVISLVPLYKKCETENQFILKYKTLQNVKNDDIENNSKNNNDDEGDQNYAAASPTPCHAAPPWFLPP